MSDLAKGLFDIVFSIVGLVVLSPFLIFVSILISLDSKGAVFYRGERIGRYGKPFRIYKFRTMYPQAEKGGSTSTLNDPRVTRIGKTLRRYKIDEIPQLINVLKGDMSIVGPRPEVEEHTSVYNEEEKRILDVKPGISDFASIRFADLAAELGSENPHDVYVNELRSVKNQLRLKYVYCRSFWVDIKIIFQTVWVITRKMFSAR